MKKLLSIMIAVCMMFSFACAEDSLKRLTLAELRQMIQIINAEIVTRPEWKGTDIPSGVWIVGQDIPAGEYSISMIGNAGAYIMIEGPASYLSSSFFFNQTIYSEEENIGRIELKNGYTVTIENGSLHFAPPVSLGF